MVRALQLKGIEPKVYQVGKFKYSSNPSRVSQGNRQLEKETRYNDFAS